MREQTEVSIAEYAAVRDGGAGLIDLSSRGRILVSGSEAVMFLNGLITNDLKTLAKDSWMPAIFPNVQGRLLAAVRIINRGDEGFILDTEKETRETVLKLVGRFTLAGDFRVKDLSDELTCLSIQGDRADEIVRGLFGETPSRQESITAKFSNEDLTIIRASHTAEDGFDLFISSQNSGALSDAMTKAGAVTISDETREVLRIEAGIPRFGIDMDDSTVVSETNLDDAISFTKGCYIGQEIIARIKYRGHVAKKLAGIRSATNANLAGEASVWSIDEKEIGRITSAAFSPTLDCTVAMAYVKYGYLEPETKVIIKAGDQSYAGEVAALPHVSGAENS